MGMSLVLKGGDDGLEVVGRTLGEAASRIRAAGKRARRANSSADVEAEKDWWRQRPRVKEPSSLAKPMRRVAQPHPGDPARAGG